MLICLETHYYDGGFKAQLIPAMARPPLLPPPEHVGLRSTEAELAKGDYAIEHSVFHRGAQRVTWLACYTGGFDCLHGERGTYCGAGVWLTGAGLVHSLYFLDLLKRAADELAAQGRPSAALTGKLMAFVELFPELGWCVPAQDTAGDAAGTSSHASAPPPAYIVLPGRGRQDFHAAGLDIIGRCMQRRPDFALGRAVYFLAPASKLFIAGAQPLSGRGAAAGEGIPAAPIRGKIAMARAAGA